MQKTWYLRNTSDSALFLRGQLKKFVIYLFFEILLKGQS